MNALNEWAKRVILRIDDLFPLIFPLVLAACAICSVLASVAVIRVWMHA
jgi:hypothetical protein